MGTWKKMKVREAVAQIQQHKMLLPAIQRKYVWSEDQIVELMDSVLTGYPIGTFLIWSTTVGSAKRNKYSFYSFIVNYHEKDACVNERYSIASLRDDDSIQGVLDGQQRLNSFLIALDGSYAAKLPRKHWNNPDAFPKKTLFFNLLSGNGEQFDDFDLKYEFAFFETPPVPDDSHLWFKVPDILAEVSNRYEFVRNRYGSLGYSEEVLYTIIQENLDKLYRCVHESEDIINYYEVQTDDMDEVLDIFVRTNSGGTVLSKSDLLFSVIVSSWQSAREKFDFLIKRIGDEGFRIDSDFIVHACLMLLDRNVNLKVRNLDKDSIDKIRESWSEISEAISKSFKLLRKLGLNHEFVTSYNAVIPVIYLAFKGCDLDRSETEIQRYLAIAQAKQLFSRSTNSTLGRIRDALRRKDDETGEFLLREPVFSRSQLDGVMVGSDSFQMSTEDIDSLFCLNKGPGAYSILLLLYPNLKLDVTEFHMDHLHPAAGFDDEKLKFLDLSPKRHAEWKDTFNTLANLQLLEGRANESKNAMPLVQWIKDEKNFRQIKFVPDGTSFELEDFDEFMEARKNEMTKELKRIFA